MELFEQVDDAQFIPLLIENGFQNISIVQNINSNIISNIKNIIQIATYEMNVDNISNIEDTVVLKNLTNRLEDSDQLSNFARRAVGSSKNPILSRIKYSCALAIVGMLVVTGGAVTIIGGTAGSGTALAWFMVSKAIATLVVIDSCRRR